MKVCTLIRLGQEYQLGVLELTLVPGLPQWQILGLPDQASKEALVRVSAALRSHGFDVPLAQKVLVQLHPADRKKQCHGIDLALALALLLETGQLSVDVQKALGFGAEGEDQNSLYSQKAMPFAYGSLSLQGEVVRPPDIGVIGGLELKAKVLTGQGANDKLPLALKRSGHWALQSLADLRDLSNCWQVASGGDLESISQRRHLAEGEVSDYRFSAMAARAMMVAAVGEHPTLLAGPNGLGKSTWAQGLTSVLPQLKGPAFEAIQRWGYRWGEEITERPVVHPHHSASPPAILGGGYPPVPGEISRAHGGVLIMDEFLEFSSRVQESLREPLETGKIRLARHGQAPTFPARFMLVATTNLCVCGQYVPVGRHKCRCSLTRRRQYLERLSGPLLDRFSLLFWCHEWHQTEFLSRARTKAWLQNWGKGERETLSLVDIAQYVDRARAFAEKTRQQVYANHRLTEAALLRGVENLNLEQLFPLDGRSMRRKKALLAVARTVADLDASEQIELEHLEEAAQWTIYPFYALQGFS